MQMQYIREISVVDNLKIERAMISFMENTASSNTVTQNMILSYRERKLKIISITIKSSKWPSLENSNVVGSNFTRQAEKFSYCFGCPSNFLIVSDKRTTTNMDPWTDYHFMLGLLFLLISGVLSCASLMVKSSTRLLALWLFCSLMRLQWQCLIVVMVFLSACQNLW